MPTVNNQVGYQIAGVYEGTVLTSPAVIPAASPPAQQEPNIVSSVLSSTGTSLAETSTIAPIKTYNSFGVISIATQSNVVANNYMSQLTLVAGNNIVLTSNAIANSITITSTQNEVVYNGGNVSTSITPDRNNGTIQKFTLTGNITLNPPTNMSAGQSLTLILTQDSAGNRLLNANVAYLFASGFQTLSTNSDAVDMLNIFSDGSTYYTTLTVDYS